MEINLKAWSLQTVNGDDLRTVPITIKEVLDILEYMKVDRSVR